MTEFKIGDRVKYVGKHPNYPDSVWNGCRGSVQFVFPDRVQSVKVVWDDGGPCHGVFPENLELEEAPINPVWPRSEILDEAKELITGDRNLNYGTPTQNFQNTADLWTVQLGHKLKDGERFTSTDVAILMIHLKLARLIASGEKRDNYADLIGYGACAWETVVDGFNDGI